MNVKADSRHIAFTYTCARTHTETHPADPHTHFEPTLSGGSGPLSWPSCQTSLLVEGASSQARSGAGSRLWSPGASVAAGGEQRLHFLCVTSARRQERCSHLSAQGTCPYLRHVLVCQAAGKVTTGFLTRPAKKRKLRCVIAHGPVATTRTSAPGPRVFSPSGLSVPRSLTRRSSWSQLCVTCWGLLLRVGCRFCPPGSGFAEGGVQLLQRHHKP